MSASIFSVDGRVCLVTGASSGLGAHFAQVLADGGASVVGASRTRIPDTSTATLHHVHCDIRDPAHVSAAFDEAEKKFGPVDVLVNNAGVAYFGRAEETEEDELAHLFEVNVIGTARMTREAVRRMRMAGRGGSIIHVTSVMSGKTVTGLSAYSGSKAALEQMTQAQAAEWAKHGIRVNALAPGWFPTEMTRPHLERGLGSILKSRIPMRRLGALEDLDGALLLLVSDASRYMTGSVITVDGGFSAAT